MRLLVVAHTSLISGAEIALERIVVAATARGWHIDIAVPPGDFAQRLHAQGLTVLPLPDLKLPAGPLPFAAARLGLRAARTARAIRRYSGVRPDATRPADAVFVNGLLGLPAVSLARLKIPVVWLVHDVVRKPSWLLLLRLVAPAVDQAIGVSGAAAGPVRAAGIATRVVPNGTPWPVQPADPAATGAPVVGCAGALTPWKGHRVLLEAVAALPGVTLEIAGQPFPKDAAYAAELRERAGRPDLAGRVIFLGSVQDLPARIRRWSVLVSASTDPETGPLVMLEAMSVGVPVVATNHGGPAEFLGDAGLLVPPNAPAALAAALGHLLPDIPLRRSMAEAGRRLVAERFRLEARTQELLDVVAESCYRYRDRLGYMCNVARAHRKRCSRQLHLVAVMIRWVVRGCWPRTRMSGRLRMACLW